MLFSYLRSKATSISAALALGGVALATANAGPNLKLHVPSPDWRDQIMYFLMTDRFEDGNPRNNDQGAGEFNPHKESHYSGGDLAGIRKRLDYIQGLGATSVWITPPWPISGGTGSTAAITAIGPLTSNESIRTWVV